jgi:ABC-type transporter Mla MlaB component
MVERPTKATKPLRGRTVFKVTTERQRGEGVTLKLEGRLASAWVDEFARAVDDALTDDARVTLDLDGLSFADTRGVALIRDAVDRGARLVGGSEFIGALIGEERPR